MHFTIDDDIISFYKDDTIFMYYNIRRQTITLLGVIVPYNRRFLWGVEIYIFYDFTKGINQSSKICMSYDTMIKNVKFVMNHFKFSVPNNVRYCLT